METTLITLDGNLNLRDIGGYQAGTDASLRRGRVYRSDHLASLTDADLEVLSGLGIGSVFDFRGHREVELQPSRLWPGVDNHVHLPIAGDGDNAEGEAKEAGFIEKGFIEQVESGELTEVTEADVAETYIGILENHGSKFVPVLEAVASGQGAILYHCTAGKDRTGLATALIHGLCDVSQPDILHDFALSNEYRLPSRLVALRPRFAAMGIDVEPLIPALAAPQSAMVAALNHLDKEHGDIHKYVTETLGVDRRTVSSLREKLIG